MPISSLTCPVSNDKSCSKFLFFIFFQMKIIVVILPNQSDNSFHFHFIFILNIFALLFKAKMIRRLGWKSLKSKLPNFIIYLISYSFPFLKNLSSFCNNMLINQLGKTLQFYGSPTKIKTFSFHLRIFHSDPKSAPFKWNRNLEDGKELIAKQTFPCRTSSAIKKCKGRQHRNL